MIGMLGFSGKWIGWVRACLEYASISFLVNGSLTQEIKPGKGLR